MAKSNAALKTIKILQCISKYPEGINLTSIAKEVHLPKSTVFDILEALYEQDAIYYKDQYSKTYVIGAKLFGLGQSYTVNSNFISFADPYLQNYAKKHNAVCLLAKQIHDQSVYVFKTEGNDSIVTPEIGVQSNLPNTVAGLAILAYLDRDKISIYYPDLDKSKKTELIKQIDDIKAKGFCLKQDPSNNKLVYFAVPTFNFENKIVGAITVYRYKSDDSDNSIQQIQEMQQIANVVSRKQGYKG